jgi:hypothetical protein
MKKPTLKIREPGAPVPFAIYEDPVSNSGPTVKKQAMDTMIAFGFDQQEVLSGAGFVS